MQARTLPLRDAVQGTGGLQPCQAIGAEYSEDLKIRRVPRIRTVAAATPKSAHIPTDRNFMEEGAIQSNFSGNMVDNERACVKLCRDVYPKVLAPQDIPSHTVLLGPCRSQKESEMAPSEWRRIRQFARMRP